MAKPPVSDFKPQRLDAFRFAQAAARLEGEQPLASFARLALDLHEPASSDASVHWSAQGELREQAGVSHAWLHLQAQTRVPLTCQRCLAAVQESVEVDRWFRFVADEAAAEAQDDEVEEDLLALEPRPSLLDVIEDELILSLPLVPLHDQCPQPLAGAPIRQEGEPEPASERPHPFAALAKLKGRA